MSFNLRYPSQTAAVCRGVLTGLSALTSGQLAHWSKLAPMYLTEIVVIDGKIEEKRIGESDMSKVVVNNLKSTPKDLIDATLLVPYDRRGNARQMWNAWANVKKRPETFRGDSIRRPDGTVDVQIYLSYASFFEVAARARESLGDNYLGITFLELMPD